MYIISENVKITRELFAKFRTAYLYCVLKFARAHVTDNGCCSITLKTIATNAVSKQKFREKNVLTFSKV